MRNTPCKVPGCPNTYHMHGLCRPHWYQLPEVKKIRNEYQKGYYLKPGIKEKKQAYNKEYHKDRGIKDRERERHKRKMERIMTGESEGFNKWQWMIYYCKENGISAGDPVAWDQAEKAWEAGN